MITKAQLAAMAAVFVALAVTVSAMPVSDGAEGDETATTIDFATFLTNVENSNYNYNPSDVVTVKWSPTDACTVASHESNPEGCLFKDTTWLEGDGNHAQRIQNSNAQYQLFSDATDVSISNVSFLFVPADFTVTCIKDGGTLAGGYGDGTDNHLKFRDVAYTDYFANAVDKVSNKKFMTGYKGTKLFGSYDNLNRGQMAIVLYNMAKADGKMSENGLQYTELGGYITGFEDVDGNEYYAKAIAWARLAGVVNGYDETHFGPEDTITREQFAAMLLNYEKKFGDYEQADASVLDDFADASGVSSWATNAVAWGVENGILGNGGFLGAQNDIIRADAACMVYNYVK